MPEYENAVILIDDIEINDSFYIGDTRFEVMEKFHNETNIRLELFLVDRGEHQERLPETLKASATLARGFKIEITRLK